MGADSTSFLTVLSMGLFTVLSIVIGYIMLNSAVGDQVSKSAYYGYSRFVGLMESAFASGGTTTTGSASMSNVYFYPKYVIFMAYFDDILDIEYYSYEGQRLNDVAVNDDSNTLFDQIIKSSSLDRPVLQSVNNERRNELLKCIGQSCVCFGQMTTNLFVEKEYLVPNACVDICWGDDPTNYRECVKGKSEEGFSPREAMQSCNNEISLLEDNLNCKNCVDYMNKYDSNLNIKSGNNFNVLTINVESGVNKNSDNYVKLKEFSKNTKFSFIPQIIECVPLNSISVNPDCDGAPYLMKFDGDLFTIFTTSKIIDGEMNISQVLFDLFTLNYKQNDLFFPDSCYLSNEYIKSSEFEIGEEK